MNLNVKNYEDRWKHIFPFENLGDRKNFWIELTYKIFRDFYVPGEEFEESPPSLSADMLAASGAKIFRNVPSLDFSKFKLVESVPEFSDSMDSIYLVREIYGYAPLDADGLEKTYPESEPINWERPGKYDVTTGNVKRVVALSESNLVADNANKVHTLTVDNRNGAYKPGNSVILTRPYSSAVALEYWPFESDPLPILQSTATTIVVGWFTWYRVSRATGVRTGDSVASSTLGIFREGANKSAEQIANTREPEIITLFAEKRVSFFENKAGRLPELEQQFAIRIGGALTNILTDVTDPTVGDYTALEGAYYAVLGKEPELYKLNALPSSAEPFYGTIWKKTSYLVPYQ